MCWSLRSEARSWTGCATSNLELAIKVSLKGVLLNPIEQIRLNPNHRFSARKMAGEIFWQLSRLMWRLPAAFLPQ